MNFNAPKISKSIKAFSLTATSLAMIVSFQNCSHDQDGGFSSDVNTQTATSIQASLSPQQAEIQAGTPQTITSADAPAGAKFYLVSGDGSVDPDTGIYTAPMHATVAVIGMKLGDLASTLVSTITVKIPDETITMTTSPSNAVISSDSLLTITPSGGQAPYTYELKEGSVATGTFHQGLGIFHALTGGSATIVITDAYGVKAEVKLTVSSVVKGMVNEGSTLALSCPTGTTIQTFSFFNYGTSVTTDTGYAVSNSCGLTMGSFINSMNQEGQCIGKASCSIKASNDVFTDPCDGITKSLAAIALCSVAGPANVTPNQPPMNLPGMPGYIAPPPAPTITNSGGDQGVIDLPVQ